MNRDQIINEYFNWLLDFACGKRFARGISYKKLLMHLHNSEYRWYFQEDENRAHDGIYLRWRFACDTGRERSLEIDEYLDGPCSILEMIIALAIRCEETIMDDTRVGDRTGQWFWGMITSLGLGHMTDDNYSKDYVNFVINRFLRNKYESNGKGGLFTIKNCEDDLRSVGIWCQLCWYLDSLG